MRAMLLVLAPAQADALLNLDTLYYTVINKGLKPAHYSGDYCK